MRPEIISDDFYRIWVFSGVLLVPVRKAGAQAISYFSLKHKAPNLISINMYGLEIFIVQ